VLVTIVVTVQKELASAEDVYVHTLHKAGASHLPKLLPRTVSLTCCVIEKHIIILQM